MYSVRQGIVIVEKVLRSSNVLVMMNGLIRGCVPDRQVPVDEDAGRIHTLLARRILLLGNEVSFDCLCEGFTFDFGIKITFPVNS